MLSFNSHIFLFLILPLSSVFTLMIRRYSRSFYILSLGFLSCLFYHLMDYSHVGILVGSIFVNFFFIKKHIPLGLSVSANLLALLVFKYLRWGTGDSPYIPLGISFFILQQISSLVDTKKVPEKAEKLTFNEYFTYVSMYPQLIAGPIIRITGFVNQIRTEKIFGEVDFRKATLFIIMGLFKKVVVADSIAAYVVPGLNLWQAGEIPPHANILTHNILYGFMVYYDFSGYSEMAVGIAHLMGFKLPKNFDSPFKQTTITGLWRNWHITIHNFMIDYFFRPFIRYLKPMPALFLTFFFISVWHGSTTNFILFGLYHALLVTAYKLVNIKWPKAVGIPLTSILFGAGSVLFYGRQNLARMSECFVEQFSSVSLNTFSGPDFAILLVACAFTYFMPNTYDYIREEKYNIKNKYLESFFFALVCFVTAIFMDRTRGYIYFEF